MSEQELYMMSDERGKDEISAQNLMKKHASFENEIDLFYETVLQLGDIAKQLVAAKHPSSDEIILRQAQLDKLFNSLKDLALERRTKLEEALQLFNLNREVDDLMQWIGEKEVVAASQELGQDYDHVTMLRSRFKEFAKETESIGRERVSNVNFHADKLITAHHADSATIAEWKDMLNEAWADLLELVETRTQMLHASWKLHRFFYDCADVLGRIIEKQNAMPYELGRDAVSVSSLQRKHIGFEHDLQTLGSAVQQIQDDAVKFNSIYAGERANEISNKVSEVVNAWQKLLHMCETRREKLADTGDLFRFLNMVRDLMQWMEETVRMMNTSEKPRDVSGVELLMNNHQSLKAEIDTREDNISVCINLGKELLARNHYASNEIKEKLLSLTNQRTLMMDRWDERWEHLQLILEVYQFARDAAVAEAWLIAQDPYLLSQELGHTLDEVEQLIKKHEAFEKSATAQEERFAALKILTTLELKEQSHKSGDQQAFYELDDHMRHSGYYEPYERDQALKTEAERKQEQERLTAESSKEVDIPSSTDVDTSITEVSSLSEREKSQKTDVLLRPSKPHKEFEGVLMRKHNLESTNKRASNRSWEKVYILVKENKLLTYKDQKHCKQEPENYHHGESPVDLRGSSAEIATDYTKRRHVFRLRFVGGGEDLFQAKDEEEMIKWISQLQQVSLEGIPVPGYSQTLPLRREERKDEQKRRSLFAMKKK